MNKSAWAAICTLPLLADPAAAIYYVYIPAPDAAQVVPQGIFFEVNDIDHSGPRLNETFHLSTTYNFGQSAGSGRTIFSDVTLTTDATGNVVAWAATGYNRSFFISYDYSSAFQPGQFLESIQSTILFGMGTPQGPFFSPSPGQWIVSSVSLAVPEPATLATLLGGLALVTGKIRRRLAVK